MKRISDSISKDICLKVKDYGDFVLGDCAYRSNVIPANSLDELGRERFHW